jgi:hypothetical protein
MIMHGEKEERNHASVIVAKRKEDISEGCI